MYTMLELPKGVYLSGKKFIAKIRVEGVLRHLGTFATVKEAETAFLNKQTELGVQGNNCTPRIKETL